MKNSPFAFPYRVLLFLFFCTLAYIAPWWAVFFPAFVAACLYQWYFECIFFAFVMDILTGVAGLTFFGFTPHFPFILTIASLILFPLAYKIQKRSRFS